MADMKCKPKLFVGSGCTQLKAKSSVHWKILPSMITRNNTWIVAAHSSDEKKEMFDWFTLRSEESAQRQVVGETTLFFAGFDAYKSKSHELCFVANKEAPANKFYEYHVPDATSMLIRYYTFDFHCNGKKIEETHLKLHDVAAGKNDCQLSGCTRTDEATTTGGTTGGSPSSVGPPDDTHTDDADAENMTQTKKGGKAEGDVEDVNDNVNRQLLIYAVEMAFPHFTGPTDSMMTAPRNSWILLERIFELAKQTCYKIVKPDFLSRVLKYFKIAHFGENFEYDEYFSDTDTQQILSMLDVCQERATRYREMDIEVDTCTGQASMVRIEDKTKQIISRSSDDTGYQEVRHHHVMEVTWDVIDMWNAVCISEFKSSYLLYHRLETGLELLFNDKLRKLWHFPNVTEEYYQKLLGPDEGIQLLNLHQCVLAAYKGNARINRMERPNKGRNTVMGNMIRSRMHDETLKKGIPSRSMGNPNAEIKTACIKGPTIRCHRKPSKNKRGNGLLSLMNKKG